jgi:hypothetical protein
MDRIKILRRILTAACTLVAVVLLANCPNPFNLLKTLETEVKVANNKFLLVQSVSPVKNAANVNPSQQILIEFDRDVQSSTLTDANILIDPTPSEPGFLFDTSYESSTRTLTMRPVHFLDNQAKYKITITKNVRGTDGSDLQTEYMWTFDTGIFPAGGIQINNDDRATKFTSAALKFFPNAIVDKYRYSFVSGLDLESKIWETPLVSTRTLPDPADPATPLTGGDGLKTVWVQYYDEDTLTASIVQTDTIYLDRVAPSVDAGTNRYLNASTYNTTGTTPYIAASDATSGIKTYSWSGDAGLVFSDTAIQNPTITAPLAADGSYTATLMVTDYAGNPASDSLTITKDIVPPGAPVWQTGSMDYAPWYTKYHYTANVAPIWVWAAGGSGNGTFLLSLADSRGRIIDELKQKTTSYQFSRPLEDGRYILTVEERDTAGNWASSSWSFDIAPIIPIDVSTGVPTTMYFQWHPYAGADSYRVYLDKTDFLDTTSTKLTWPKALAHNTQYKWLYQAYSGGKLIYRSNEYSFITTK